VAGLLAGAAVGGDTSRPLLSQRRAADEITVAGFLPGAPPSVSLRGGIPQSSPTWASR